MTLFASFSHSDIKKTFVIGLSFILFNISLVKLSKSLGKLSQGNFRSIRGHGSRHILVSESVMFIWLVLFFKI